MDFYYFQFYVFVIIYYLACLIYCNTFLQDFFIYLFTLFLYGLCNIIYWIYIFITHYLEILFYSNSYNVIILFSPFIIYYLCIILKKLL